MALIEAEHFSFAYPQSSQNVLNDLCFCVEEGEFILFCGPSGSGKTTLLRHLKHSIAPYGTKSGQIRFDGKPIESCSARQLASEIGFVFQNPEEQIVCDQAFAEMAFGPENLGFPPSEIRRRVAEMASFFGIERFFEQDTHLLSGGQKQILNLASVLVTQPKLLILDEPTSQLDPISAGEFLSALQKLNRELGLTVLISEHRLEDFYPLADRVCLMEAGEIRAFAPPQECARWMFQHAHPMALALPVPVQVAHRTAPQGEAFPLTIREGRAFLREHRRPQACAPAVEPSLSSGLLCEAKQVFFRYEKHSPDILKGCSLALHKGEMLALFGGNGTGKTTLLHLFAGLLAPYRGSIKQGHECRSALLPQNPRAVFLKDRFYDDLLFLARQNSIPVSRIEELIARYSFFQPLPALFDRNPMDFSGGELQRASLFKLLLLSPSLLLLDEPTKGLDAFSKQRLAEILAALQRDGIGFLLATHDIEFAAAYADSCALLFRGEVVSCAPPHQFFTNNRFYTTQACKLSQGILPGCITGEEVAERCI